MPKPSILKLMLPILALLAAGCVNLGRRSMPTPYDGLWRVEATSAQCGFYSGDAAANGGRIGFLMYESKYYISGIFSKGKLSGATRTMNNPIVTEFDITMDSHKYGHGVWKNSECSGEITMRNTKYGANK